MRLAKIWLWIADVHTDRWRMLGFLHLWSSRTYQHNSRRGGTNTHNWSCSGHCGSCRQQWVSLLSHALTSFLKYLCRLLFNVIFCMNNMRAILAISCTRDSNCSLVTSVLTFRSPIDSTLFSRFDFYTLVYTYSLSILHIHVAYFYKQYLQIDMLITSLCQSSKIGFRI